MTIIDHKSIKTDINEFDDKQRGAPYIRLL